MTEINYQEAAAAFSSYNRRPSNTGDNAFSATPVSGGLINNSWKVLNGHIVPFLLQQINTSVFNNPGHVQQNYVNIWQYAELRSTGLRLPIPLYYSKGNTLYQDGTGRYWRAFEFIDDSTSKLVAQNPEQARETAKTFAKFTAAFSDFDIRKLEMTIPDFHNLSFRYKQFEESLHTKQIERRATAREIVDGLKKREQYKIFYDWITETPDKFPMRVMHHDAKIANVLFSKKTGEVICAVDFDTVMPGYYFSDLGDMIRSMACSVDENCKDLPLIEIRGEYYEAIVNGYLEVMQDQLTKAEKKYIHYAGILMIYMQALRFITDYLNGDIYYRIQYATQNYDRASNQMTLLKKLEVFLQENHQFNPHETFPEK